jgi:hypothetical protein
MSTETGAKSDASNAATQFVAPISDPFANGAQTKDSKMAQRLARTAKLAEELNSASQKEFAEVQLAKLEGRVPPQHPDDVAAAKEAGEPANPADRVMAAEAKGEAPGNVEEKSAEEVAEAAEPAVEDKGAKLDRERKEKFDRTLRMQAKIRERDERVRQTERQIAEKEREISAREEALGRQHEEARRTRAIAERVLKLAEENPIELLEKAGVSAEKVAGWLKDSGDPIKQDLQATKREISDLRDQLKSEKEAAQTEREKERAARNQQAAEQQFLDIFDQQKESLEAARLVFSKRERVALGNEIAERANKRGIKWSFADIAEAVNEMAKADERYQEIAKRTAKKEEPKPAAAAPAAAATAKPPAVALTNKASQTTAQLTTSVARKLDRRARLARLYAELDAKS